MKNYEILERNEELDFLTLKVKSILYKNQEFPNLNVNLSILKNKNEHDVLNEIALSTIQQIIELNKTKKEERIKPPQDNYIDFEFNDITNAYNKKIINSEDIDIDIEFIN